MAVEFGQNVENITIFEKDDPQELAMKFCLKHGFDDNVQDIIVENIKLNKNLAIEDMNKQGTAEAERDQQAQRPEDVKYGSANEVTAAPILLPHSQEENEEDQLSQ